MEQDHIIRELNQLCGQAHGGKESPKIVCYDRLIRGIGENPECPVLSGEQCHLYPNSDLSAILFEKTANGQ
ncbi:hypothetical protein C4577_04320 [Candidatus Parcubacteria bacterium]|nr:MAG: hypothetical protein C4577_04320 [Candidatus Parcubacteria bacterium]